MPQQAAFAVENNFSGGLITEATGLNFPENACTETFNCEFNLDGSVNRRLGFDFEAEHTTQIINRAGKAVSSYLWKNVSGNGDIALCVLQVGLTIYFYNIIADSNYSSGALATTVTLSPNAGAVDSETFEAQFSDGNGFLFITHPHCSVRRVSYDTATQVATATIVSLMARDFEGATADPYAVDTRPTSTLAGLDVNHKYNLLNQGWTTTTLTAWDTAQTTMPSNVDVPWSFKDATNNFDASAAAIARVYSGNTAAPKGHFILSVSNPDRDGTAGTSGVASSGSSFQRSSTSTFFAGRIFYSGINHVKFNSKIYFSQIVTRDEQYGFCYQQNDPTAEDLFDLLPSDGGVISIPEAGTIYKLFTISGGITVHAENGVWYITGSSGVGFAANDYSVIKIANIPSISASSFVNVAGFPAWWNNRGIYLLTLQGSAAVSDPSNSTVRSQAIPSVQPLTDQKILSFFTDIPQGSKKHARGIYHYLDNHIRWIYRSTATDQVSELYEYDRVLNFNTLTGAFSPWTISDSPIKVNAIIPSDVVSGNISTSNVVDASVNNVIDGSSNQVIAFFSTGAETSPFDKYIVSYPEGGTYKFTFSDKVNADYLDWFTFDSEGISFDSYLITGYKVRGQAIKKFQNIWVRIFSELREPTSYNFQGIWDYATTGSGTGRWSVKQLIQHPSADYAVVSKRIKVRGHGIALQFRLESVDGEPFHIIGWATLQSGNASP